MLSHVMTDRKLRPASFYADSDEVTRALVENRAADALIDDVSVFDGLWCGPDTFHYLRNQVYPPYKTFQLSQRFNSVTPNMGSFLASPPFFMAALGCDDTLTAELLTLSNGYGETFWHIISHGLCFQTVKINKWPGIKQHSQHPKWAEFMGKLLIMDASNISKPDSSGLTPLMGLVRFWFWFSYTLKLLRIQVNPSLLQVVLRLWLGELRNIGIDLEKYAAKEMHSVDFGQRDFNWGGRDDSLHGRVRLIKMECGPCPEDWHFWLSEPTDEFAGDFWTMTEDQEEFRPTVPGSWVDEDR